MLSLVLWYFNGFVFRRTRAIFPSETRADFFCALLTFSHENTLFCRLVLVPNISVELFSYFFPHTTRVLQTQIFFFLFYNMPTSISTNIYLLPTECKRVSNSGLSDYIVVATKNNFRLIITCKESI